MAHQTVYGLLDSYQKSGKTNDPISRNVEKTSFLGPFWPKFTQIDFFSKIGLRHIRGSIVLHLCAENQKKLMTQSRENLITDARKDGRTDGRTDGHRSIYRTFPLRGRSKKMMKF